MKKSLIMLVLLSTVLLSGCMSRIYDTEDFIQKAREIIPITDADSAAMTAVESDALISGSRRLVWIISGNEYQRHYYMPVEFQEIGKDYQKRPYYKFVHDYNPVERCIDIAAVQWNGGISFLVNNKLCRAVRITDKSGSREYPVTGIPCVICYDDSPSFEYNYIDIDGNEMIS